MEVDHGDGENRNTAVVCFTSVLFYAKFVNGL